MKRYSSLGPKLRRQKTAAGRRGHPADSPRASQRGFTLVEVLLALSLTAMLLSLLSAGMYVVVRDWNAETSALDAQLDEAIILLQLERALVAAMPHSFNNPDTLIREIYFQGESDSLRWVSTLSPLREGGLTAWSLENRGSEGLELRLAPAYSDDPTLRLDDAEARRILPGYTLEVNYLREPNDTAREWVTQWEGSEQAALPLAVQLRFVPQSASAASRAAELELVAPIKAWRHRSIMPTGLGAGLGQ